MLELLRTIARSVASVAQSRRALALENVALRHQLAYYVGASALTSIKDTSTDQNSSAESWTFTYDGENQQREAIGTGGDRELYYYDEAGQRYMTVHFTAGTLDYVRVWNGPVETRYGAAGNVVSDWAHVSLGAQNIARIDDRTDAELSYHNGLQHFMGSVDFDTGNVNTAFIYGPYGEVLEKTAGAFTDEHLRRFNGKEADQLSKLSYYGYRYYDWLSLTWTQADPMYLVAPDIAYDEPRRMSLYTFSLNNPVRYYDPDGRDGVILVGQDGTPVRDPQTEKQKEREKKRSRFNANTRKAAEKLKKEIVASSKTLGKDDVHLVTRDQLQPLLDHLEEEGIPLSFAIGIGHGGNGSAESGMNLTGRKFGTESIIDLIDRVGLAVGGAFIAVGCMSCTGMDDAALAATGRFVAGFEYNVGFADSGNFQYPNRTGTYTTPGNAVPDLGPRSGPYRPDSGKTVKQIALEAVQLVEEER